MFTASQLQMIAIAALALLAVVGIVGFIVANRRSTASAQQINELRRQLEEVQPRREARRVTTPAAQAPSATETVVVAEAAPAAPAATSTVASSAAVPAAPVKASAPKATPAPVKTSEPVIIDGTAVLPKSIREAAKKTFAAADALTEVDPRSAATEVRERRERTTATVGDFLAEFQKRYEAVVELRQTCEATEAEMGAVLQAFQAQITQSVAAIVSKTNPAFSVGTTPSIAVRARRLASEGHAVSEIARELGTTESQVELALR